MKNYTIKRYDASDFAAWNAFNSKAKNATFLFHRDFMEYHSDRFEDFSLMVFDDEKLVCILPANRSGDKVYSHGGLTYGGFVFASTIRLSKVLEIFGYVLLYLNQNKIAALQIKMLPSFYAQYSSDEITYALFITDAQLVRRDCLSVIDMSKPVKISAGRSEGIKRGAKNSLTVCEESDLATFWNDILIPNLQQKHAAAPVHMLAEITYLKSKFPKNIRQFNVYHEGKIVAGTTIFESENVAHAQYISAKSNGKNELGSLDFLYNHLLKNVFVHKKFFDFGISNENSGRNINQGLLYWKESFGSQIVTQDFYEVDTANFTKTSTVLL